MAKYLKKKEKKKFTAGKVLLLVLLAVLVAGLILVVNVLRQRNIPVLEQGTAVTETAALPAEQTEVEQVQQEATEPQYTALDYGLQLHYIGSYAGMYMEDGTNEAVSDVMMLIVENGGEQDLQLARIHIAFSTFTAEFEVTNLPVGEKVVLLEKNRAKAVQEEYQDIQVRDVVHFQEAMNLWEDWITIEGQDGTLKVTNISGEDISSDIYIYYKHSAADLLYGGITYRVTIRGGLSAGESTTVIAGHYTPDTCRLLMSDWAV